MITTITKRSFLQRARVHLTRSNNHLQAVNANNAENSIHIKPALDFTIRFHQSNANTNPRDINITFKTQKNELVTVKAAKGETLLQIAHRNVDEGVEMEGACEGVCACSTCHVILEDEIYDLSGEPSEDEEDMLDMAFGLTTTSRLGCQVNITKEMDGSVFELPGATRNFYVDGHVPKPH